MAQKQAATRTETAEPAPGEPAPPAAPRFFAEMGEALDVGWETVADRIAAWTRDRGQEAR